MIIGLCSAKGSPGVSTLAVAAAAVTPGEPVLVEADPAGADGPFRLRSADGRWLDPEPWLGSLAAASRLGPAGPHSFAQDTLVGVPVVPGGRTPAELKPMEGLWGKITDSLTAATCPVIVDFGRVTTGHIADKLIAAADVLLVVCRTDTASLAHARDLAGRLLELVGLGPNRAAKVMLVPVGEKLTVRARRVTKDVGRIITSAGLPCPVAGVIPFDAKAAAGLVSGPMTRFVAGSDLVRAAQKTVTEVWRQRPDLAAELADQPAGNKVATDTDESEPSDSTDSLYASGPGGDGRAAATEWQGVGADG